MMMIPPPAAASILMEPPSLLSCHDNRRETIFLQGWEIKDLNVVVSYVLGSPNANTQKTTLRSLSKPFKALR